MTITETQKTAQLAADAAVSAAEAKQYMLEAEQGYQDTSAAAQQARMQLDQLFYPSRARLHQKKIHCNMQQRRELQEMRL
ncbi:hypothetical protein ACYCA5_28560 [Klebsiella pneumoniae]